MMQTPSAKTRIGRAFSVKEREKGGAPVSSVLGSPVDGAKPFEVYGFVGSIGSFVAYVVYIIWAYIPESWLHAVGITYYPSRYWAVAVPSYLIISVLFICILYLSLNFMATPPPQSRYSIYDEYSRPGMDPNLSLSHWNVDQRPIIPSFSDMPLTEDRVIFRGIRTLIHSFEISNPRSVLRVINKREASLADKAAGLHVRFRLDGRQFPPTVVYKVYTHRPVVDLCSFSPRHYADGRRKCKETYLRWENNSWRPVTGTPAVQSGPKVKLEAQEEHGAFFTHSLQERRILKLLDFKKRKRAWLMKLYTVSRAQTAPAAVSKDLEGRTVTAPAAVSEHQEKWGGNIQEESFENTSENVRQRALDLELLRWSAGLDYDEFEQDWYRLATSIPEEYDRDWCKLGTTFPRGYESLPAVPSRSSSVACS